MEENLMREEARRKLLDNARQVSRDYAGEISGWDGLVTAHVDGRELGLPGYIPYIGSAYFSVHLKRRRILVYAMSQNLKPEKDYVQEWAKDWHEGDGITALDRQQDWYSQCGQIAMHPFDTGHAPVLCALVRHLLSGDGSTSSHSIYDEVAATNLSKFSFRSPEGHTTDEPQCHEKCWDWFARQEIEVLRPDVVLCLGDMVHGIVSERLDGRGPPRVLHAAFPSRRVINRWFGKSRVDVQKSASDICAVLSNADLHRAVKKHSLQEVIEQDATYFAAMWAGFEQQLRGDS